MKRIVVVYSSARVSRTGERIKLSTSSMNSSLPVKYVEAIVAFGSLELSSHALSLLMQNNIPVFFLTRLGALKAVLWTKTLSSNTSNRIRQYEKYVRDPFGVAKEIVKAKIRTIEREFGLKLDNLISSLERASTKEELLCIEGTASRLMFEKFSQNIELSGFSFRERAYRPPPDPVNALLSLSYTLTYSLSLPVTTLMGYDPYISFLHTRRGNHLALCSDIMKPVRPILTKRLEEPILRGVFTKKDFNREKAACYLKKESIPKFLSWFESQKEEVLRGIKESLSRFGEVLL